MAKDSTSMKTVIFGGFKKSDVLALIEELQLEIADIKNSLDEKRREVLDLRNQVEELDCVNKLLSEKEAENIELSAKLDAALSENTVYRQKIDEFQEKSDKIQRAEKQIGAVYIDARRYSDELVENARAKAKDIGSIASQDIKRESVEIEALLRDVDIISKKFNTSIEQLHRDVYSLSSKLNTAASNLLNIHTDLAELNPVKYEFDASISDEIEGEVRSEVIIEDEVSDINADVNVVEKSDDEDFISVSFSNE